MSYAAPDPDSDGTPDEQPAAGRVPPGSGPVVALGSWPWPKRYAVTGSVGIVGYTDLEVPILYGQRAAGRMVAAESYDRVRDLFALYRAAADDRRVLQQFVELRDALMLVLTDGGTLPLAAKVELISEWDDGRLFVHVAIRDRRYWSRYGAG